jgi:FtsP/CotA-like multicopper oxidase with cupredoxin domain
MDNLQQLFIYAGSISGNPVMPDKNNNFKIIISPKTQYNGYIDGILNDNLMNFSVKQESSELWIYNNLDNQDSHPLHFHMTSGFARFDNKYSSECLKNNQQSNMLEYSKDVYSIGPQQKISFNIKFVNHSSNEGQIKWLGYMYHCHFMAHHDMSMMGQFFVYKNKFI